MLRRHPCEHRHLAGGGVEVAVAELVEVAAGEDSVVGGDAELVCDGLGGQRVVTGDHHRSDPGRTAHAHRITHLAAWRVDDPDQPDDRERRFCVGGELGEIVAVRLEAAVADTEHAEPSCGHLVVRRQQHLAMFVVECDDAAAVWTESATSIRPSMAPLANATRRSGSPAANSSPIGPLTVIGPWMVLIRLRTESNGFSAGPHPRLRSSSSRGHRRSPVAGCSFGRVADHRRLTVGPDLGDAVVARTHHHGGRRWPVVQADRSTASCGSRRDAHLRVDCGHRHLVSVRVPVVSSRSR